MSSLAYAELPSVDVAQNRAERESGKRLITDSVDNLVDSQGQTIRSKKEVQARYRELSDYLDIPGNYDNLYGSLVGRAAAYIDCRHTQEDLAQDAIIKGMEGAPKRFIGKRFENGEMTAEYKGYFYGILINNIRRHYRKKKGEKNIMRRRSTPLGCSLDNQATLISGYEDRADDPYNQVSYGRVLGAKGRGPLEIAEQREIIDCTSEAMSQLRESQLAVILGMYSDDLSSRTISDLMGTSDNSVRMRVCRARKKVRKTLETKGIDENLLMSK